MQKAVSLFLAGQNKKLQPLNTTGPLLIFKMKSDYFLLTRASPKTPPEKHLMFACGDKHYYSSFSRHVNLGYCHRVMDLLENVLRVTKKKASLSNNLDLKKKYIEKKSLSLQDQWLLLYQIHGFGNQDHQMKQFQMHQPVYGEKIALLDDQLNISQSGRITSLFKLGGHLFYFLTYNKNIQEVDPYSKRSLCQQTEDKFMDALVTLSNPTNIKEKTCQSNFKPVICCLDNQIFHKCNSIPLLFGISLQIDNINLCIPFQCILSERPCKLTINPVVQYALMSTCYISFCGNYCTGIRINAKTIISTKHVLPTSDQAVGCEVKIRCFPYQQQGYGVVRRIGWDGLDFMQIDYHDQIREKFKFFEKQKEKNSFRRLLALDKQDSCFNKKIDSAQLDRLQNNIYRKICEEVEQVSKTQVAKFNAVKSIEAIFKQQSFQDSKLTPEVGNPLLAIGFGKFPYSPYLFQKLQIILPTIQSGVVSKVIKINQQTVFLKSDANLYNGFSGCGLWGYQGLLGMAVFILKNKNNQQQFNRHNFSYSTNFLSKLQRKKQNKQKKSMYSQSHIHNIIESQINKELTNFDIINNRNTINTMKISMKNFELKPKL